MIKLKKRNVIKIVISVTALILVVVMLLALSQCSTEMLRLPAFKSLSSYPSLSEETVAENDNLAIIWNDEEKIVYLYDKATGTKWGPRETLTTIDGEMTVSKKIPKIFSPIYISYYDKESCVVVEDVLAQSASIANDTVAAK